MLASWAGRPDTIDTAASPSQPLSPTFVRCLAGEEQRGNISGDLGKFQHPGVPTLIAPFHIFDLLLWVIGDRAPEAF